MTKNRSLWVAWLLLAIPFYAHAADWQYSWNGGLYGYGNAMAVRDESLINPSNQLARMAQRSITAETRLNLKAESEALRLTARPIVLGRRDDNSFGSTNTSEGYLSQWQARWRASETLALSGGRELLNWGPAQFRSPSNPFYFNNGRGNPMSELSGMDALRLSWSPEVSRSIYVARIFDSGHAPSDPDPWARSWLVKADWRGEESAVGVAVAQRAQQSVFFGAHAQRTVGDAWLLYGELGSSTRMNALISSADLSQPFTVEQETSRRTDTLLGAAYTFESGHNLTVEYLRYGHGYSAAESDAYFTRAASAAAIFPAGNSIPILANALTAAPPLLGRNYLHLVWQSSPMESSGFVRLMATHSVTDNSEEFSGYAEHTVSAHLSAFAIAVFTTGGAQRESARLFDRLITLGVRVALP